MAYQWLDPTPNNSCDTCRHFDGRVFADDDKLPLPAHPACECTYIVTDAQPTPFNWDEEPDFARQNYIYYAAWLLREGEDLPAVLEPLRAEAEAYNKTHEEPDPMTSTNRISLNTYSPPGRVDRQRHIIHGVSVAQAVEALGHGFILDNTSIQQIATLGNSRLAGIKSRFTHPGLSSDGLGKFLGRLQNWRVENDKAIADLHLSDLAASSPDGDLRTYTEDLAEKEADMFGMSAVINGKAVWVLSDGREVEANGEKPETAVHDLPSYRITELHAADLVDEPAANRDGLFGSTTNQLAAVVFDQLDQYLTAQNLTPDALPALYHQYQHNPDLIPAPLRSLAQDAIETYQIDPNKINSFIHRYVQARSVRPLTISLSSSQGGNMPKEIETAVTEPTTPTPTAPNTPVNGTDSASANAWLMSMQETTINNMLASSQLPTATVARLRKGSYTDPAQLQSAIDDAQAELAELESAGVIDIGGIHPRGGNVRTKSGAAPVFNAVGWLFGDPEAQLPPPSLRRSDELYRLLTGDLNWRGVFDGSHALAAATPTTLPGLAVNAMNKVMISLWDTLAVYRWFEMIVSVQPNDGSLHDMAWIQFGGLSNLSVVADGAAYTEKSVADTKETDAFVKHGNYVGITRKMLRNSLIGQIQAVPRALAVAAVRTRSYNIANIFMQANGLGPTLDQDSTALFDSASHGNHATTAYSIAAWKAARLECFKQTELGSSKRQGLWPKFWLGPADLYDTALIDFGYGAGAGGYTGTPNNDVNPYAESRPGDPRPVPIAVPEFTDANNWYYLADPNLAPVIQMSYSQNPGGRAHPMPELFSVVSETAGLMFTNDTMPIKVRDEYAYGVATYRGIGARIVA